MKLFLGLTTLIVIIQVIKHLKISNPEEEYFSLSDYFIFAALISFVITLVLNITIGTIITECTLFDETPQDAKLKIVSSVSIDSNKIIATDEENQLITIMEFEYNDFYLLNDKEDKPYAIRHYYIYPHLERWLAFKPTKNTYDIYIKELK